MEFNPQAKTTIIIRVISILKKQVQLRHQSLEWIDLHGIDCANSSRGKPIPAWKAGDTHQAQQGKQCT